MTAVTVEVKDADGTVVPVVAQNLATGATTAQFDFVTAVPALDLTGVWTVSGISYSFDELDLVADIVAASQAATVNEVELLALLNEAGITGINNDNLAEYAVEIATAPVPVWFADVQADINTVNEEQAEANAEAAIVKAVCDATNQIQLSAALTANFDRVNTAWIVGYAQEVIAAPAGVAMLALDADNYVGEAAGTTAAAIQTAIDAENATAIATADAAADTAAEQAAVTTLIQNWIEADDPATPLVTPKADMIEASQIKEAAYRVAEATTENSLYNALVAYANIAPDAQLMTSDLNVNLKPDYLGELNAAGVRTTTVADIKGNTIAEIVAGTFEITIKGDLVTTADAAALEDSVVALGAAATTLDTTDNAANRTAFTAALQDLANVTSHKTVVNQKFLMSTIDADLLVEYATQMDTDGIGTGDDVADVQTSVATVNADADILAAVAVVADDASTAVQVKDALITLALDDSNATTDAYMNASNQIKLETAQFIVDNNADLEDPLTAATITADGAVSYAANAIGKAMVDQAAKVAQFNAIGDLAAATTLSTKGALDIYAYAPYVALSAAQQTAVAEAINGLTKSNGAVPPVFTALDFSDATPTGDAVTTLAQANAYIDAAIAGL